MVEGGDLMENAYPVIIVVVGLAILFLLFGKRRSGPRRDDLSWFQVFVDGLLETLPRARGLFDDTAPRKRRGPDMAFSAGRDAAHQSTRLRQVFIPMEPDEEDRLRAFYLDELGLTEMRPPNSRIQQDGFWAVTGTRQIYFGTMPDFKPDFSEMPAFPVRNIRDVSEHLTELGYHTRWDRRDGYIEKLIVTDPAGTTIALIAG